MSNKKVALLLADGFEEVEALAVVDIMRRAGIECDMVSVTKREVVEGSHGISVFSNCLIEDVDTFSYDMVVLPGGLPGADTLRDTDAVISWVQDFAADSSKFVAAICAAPQVLAKAGVVKGKDVTSYPGENFQQILSEGNYIDDNLKTDECVVVDGNIITSRGPGTTFPFAYKLVDLLGADSTSLKNAMQFNAFKNYVKNS